MKHNTLLHIDWYVKAVRRSGKSE